MTTDATPGALGSNDQLGVDEPHPLREPCARCGANLWTWLRCSFRGSTPQGDVDVDENQCYVCGGTQDHA